MAAIKVPVMLNIPGYHITELIHQSNNSLVYRAFRESDRLGVILKLLRDSHPTPPEKSDLASA